MKAELIAKVSATIPATSEKVWDALTNPVLIKEYFFGTNAVSDWKVGSPIIFNGVWEGKPYEDKGKILALEKGKFLKYNYWSSFSGTDDKPENYAIVTYDLSPGKNGTLLTITQDHCLSEESKKHSESNWKMILEGLAKVVTKK